MILGKYQELFNVILFTVYKPFCGSLYILRVNSAMKYINTYLYMILYLVLRFKMVLSQETWNCAIMYPRATRDFRAFCGI